MAKHAPRPIDRRDANVAMARAAADEASLDAWLAHLSAEAAHARLDEVERAGVKIRKAMGQCAYDIGGLEYRRNLAISRGRWCSLGCYGVAVGAAIGGAFFEPLLVVSIAMACMGATLHITSVALEV